MLDSKIIEYLKSKNAWFENTDIDCEDYKDILINLGVDINSDFGRFYNYAEEHAGGFSSRDFELWQICWVYENGDYLEINEALIKDLNLSKDYYVLSEFEGESAYFYNQKENTVHLIGYAEDGISTLKKWDSFNEFLIWYFELWYRS